MSDLQREGEIKYLLDCPAWHVEAVCDLDSYQIEKLASAIADKMSMLEKERAAKVVQMYNLFKSAATHSIKQALPSNPSFSSRDNQLHTLVDKYFTKDFTDDCSSIPTTNISTPRRTTSSLSSSSSSFSFSSSSLSSISTVSAPLPQSPPSSEYDSDDSPPSRTQSPEPDVEVKTTAGMDLDESLCTNWVFMRGDVVSFLKRHGGLAWSGRNIARVFHGLSSSKFPFEEWNKDPSWGCHKSYPFNKLMELANDTIKAFQNTPGITVVQHQNDYDD